MTRVCRLDLLPRLYLPLILMLVVAFAWRPLGGHDDFWAHAAIGRWIWQHQSAPQHTLYLWSVNPPIPWIAHSWLTQVTFYVFMAVGGERFGPYLANAFTALIAALTFTWVWSLWTQRARVTSLMVLVFALAVTVSAPRFRPRPELFTAFFLCCLLAFLLSRAARHEAAGRAEEDRAEDRPLQALGIVMLFVLWANFHGAVAIGLMILTATVVGDLLQDDVCGGRFPSPAWRLVLLLALCAAAVFANPYGAAYWQALKPVTSKMFAEIDEWKPFWKHPALGYEFVAGELLLVYIALLSWLGNPQRRWAHLAWLLLMSAAFLSARRHLWLLALVSLAVMAYNAHALDTAQLWRAWSKLRDRRARRKVEPPARSIYDDPYREPPVPPALDGADQKPDEIAPMPDLWRDAVRAGIALFLFIGVLRGIPHDVLPLRAVSRYLPTGAVRSMDEHKLQGRMFNDYENSSYLLWHFAGRRPLYIDLLNAYPDQLLMDYFDVIWANPRGRKLMDKWDIRYVFLRRHKETEGISRLKHYLNKSPQWQRVYGEADGSVWRRVTRAATPAKRTPASSAPATKRGSNPASRAPAAR